MNHRKRMGNDPFENIVHTTEENYNAPALTNPKSDYVPEEAYAGDDEDNLKSSNREEIRDILKQTAECIKCQQEEIALLRLQMNELKKRTNSNIMRSGTGWLRFWFPWFPKY